MLARNNICLKIRMAFVLMGEKYVQGMLKYLAAAASSEAEVSISAGRPNKEQVLTHLVVLVKNKGDELGAPGKQMQAVMIDTVKMLEKENSRTEETLVKFLSSLEKQIKEDPGDTLLKATANEFRKKVENHATFCRQRDVCGALVDTTGNQCRVWSAQNEKHFLMDFTNVLAKEIMFHDLRECYLQAEISFITGMLEKGKNRDVSIDQILKDVSTSFKRFTEIHKITHASHVCLMSDGM